jgi:hypothetical protein
MSPLESIRRPRLEKSDFSHYQKVTKVTLSHDFRLLTLGLVWSKLGALQ